MTRVCFYRLEKRSLLFSCPDPPSLSICHGEPCVASRPFSLPSGEFLSSRRPQGGLSPPPCGHENAPTAACRGRLSSERRAPPPAALSPADSTENRRRKRGGGREAGADGSPYNVLITGSSKGIGYALAREFLKAGDKVILCSRSGERVESAVQELREEFGEQHVWGTVCDVREAKDVRSLVAFAQDKLKSVDIWINNAGSNAYSYKPLAETSDEDLMEVVTTNTLGLMICCLSWGHIFNMDGAGSDGRPTPRFAAYGATKRSVVHLTKSLQAELQMHEVKNVMVHNLSPGMVTTDLLMSGANTKQAKFFINILAETPEVVAEYLVRCIRVVPNKGTMKPTYIRFLTGLKAYSQIFSRFAFGTRRNRYVIED
ncbi:unnamed protein product [Spirodela intermedia]|uniref:chlorophyll(ide) b reductase n=1 Tax=Spirodela intermedia TaxID=51605 RepID=A0A7I8IL61_SPIIN|nr:unnamed protein product [Spirodela intermedia]CAA6658495.1 unnamed protein product [Spirodela intermedia]